MTCIYSMPGHLIRRLHQISASLFADAMRRAGADLTSPQYAALTLLHDHPGIDQATLAGLIALDRPTIGGVVDRLVAKGLLHREISPTDRRARILTLTGSGQELLERIRPIVAEIQPEILAGLDASEQAQFLKLAEKIARANNCRSRAPLVVPDSGDTAPAPGPA